MGSFLAPQARPFLQSGGHYDDETLWTPEDHPHPWWRQFRPIVIMYFGRRGKGKTLAMSTVAKYQQLRYRHNNVKMQIMANYHLEFADRASPYIVNDMASYPDWARDAILCIDEVGSQFPSRRSLAGVNLNFANFLTQVRKRNVEVMFTTQFPQVVDQLVLLQCDLFVECDVDRSGRTLDLYIHDWWGQWTGKTQRKPWPPDSDAYDEMRTIYNPKQMFGSYRTSEVIAAQWDKRRDETIRTEGWGDPEDEESNVSDLHIVEINPDTMMTEFLEANVPGDVFVPTEFIREIKIALGLGSRWQPDVVKRWLRDHGWKIDEKGQGHKWNAYRNGAKE